MSETATETTNETTPEKPIRVAQSARLKPYTLAELRGFLVIAIDFNQPPRRNKTTRGRVRALRWRIRAKLDAMKKLSPSSPRRRHRGVSADAD